MKGGCYHISIRDVRRMNDINKLKEKFRDYMEKFNEPFCIYIDFPFCISKCKYCIYRSYEYCRNVELVKEYTNALLQQIKTWSDVLTDYSVDKLYYGGGTPNLFDRVALQKIVNEIPHYCAIPVIKSELHPRLMNDELVDFYAEVIRTNIISLGVQSFDKNACLAQNRLYASPQLVKQIVNRFKKHNIWINVDLVALFGGDSKHDWYVFDKDLELTCNYILPDIITCVPNYKTNLKYLEQIPKFREILGKYSKERYTTTWDKMLSMDKKDIEEYGYNDHCIATEDYWEFHRKVKPYSCSAPIREYPNQVVLSFGGLDSHKVYSYLPNDDYVVYSFYDSKDHKIKYEIKN